MNSSLRPGRVLDSFGSLMCPNGLGKSKPGINKTYLSRHVLETTSKSNTLDSWCSATLTVPDGADKVIDRPPIAPPRKKRGTLERDVPPQRLKVKNGFKDVFGVDSRRQSYDVPTRAQLAQDKVDEGLQNKSKSCYEIDANNDAFSDFSKVPTKTELEKPKVELTQLSSSTLSKVGNKKSDKFFGENLSDALSTEPVSKERRRSSKKGMEDLDKIDQFIEKNALQTKAKITVKKDVPRIEITKPDAMVAEEKVNKVKPPQAKKDTELSKEEQENEENLIKYIDETVGMETSLGKKAEFLMAMLEDYPEDGYFGLTPVEEPIIVPRKRKSRHICDDDHHMHDLLHQHNKGEESSKKLITTEASIETPPRKPSRDFAKYLVSMDGCSDSDDSNLGRPIRKHRPPSRKSLPSPPMPPKFTKSLSETQFRYNLSDISTSTPKKVEVTDEAKAHTPRMLKRIISMPSTANLVSSRSTTPQPTLLKSSSSSSFLVKDLQKAHSSVVRYTPEDHHHYAADELVKPKSRLTTRKISVKSNDSLPCTPTPTQEMFPPKFTIGSIEVVRSPPSPISVVPPPVPKRRKSSNNELKQGPLYEPVSHSKPLSKELWGYDLGSYLESSKVLHHHDITNVIENVYNATDGEENIIHEFQLYLEDQINSAINDPNCTSPNTVKLLEVLNSRKQEEEDKLENVKIDLVNSDDSNKSSDIDDCFDPEFEKIEKPEVDGKSSKKESTESADDVGDWFESSSDVESVVEGSDKLGNMVSVKSGVGRVGRRESIEDVGSWFENHIDAFPGEAEIIGVRKQRREADGYDTSKQYPFGVVQHRRDSLSADLFEDITKLHEMGVIKDKPGTPLTLVKNQRMQERRGSDGLVLYDTDRKFPFGEPNTDLPKAMEEEEQRKKTNNETKETLPTTKSNTDDKTPKELEPCSGNSDHSTLLKFLSKENLAE